MSFSVCDRRSGFEYNGNNLNSLFAQRRNLLSPGFWGMLRDILRFNREAPADLQAQRISADMTLGDYLDTSGYGPRFIRHGPHRTDGRCDLVDVPGGHARFPLAVLCALLQEPRLAVGEQPPAMVRDRGRLKPLHRTADPQLS